jgi:hypothetical protein
LYGTNGDFTYLSFWTGRIIRLLKNEELPNWATRLQGDLQNAINLVGRTSESRYGVVKFSQGLHWRRRRASLGRPAQPKADDPVQRDPPAPRGASSGRRRIGTAAGRSFRAILKHLRAVPIFAAILSILAGLTGGTHV